MISNYYTESAVYVSQTTSTGWGTEPHWSTAPSTFAAAINPNSGQIAIAGEKETAFADYKLFCSDTVALVPHCRVRYSGSTYDVLFVKDTLNRGHHKLAYLKKIT